MSEKTELEKRVKNLGDEDRITAYCDYWVGRGIMFRIKKGNAYEYGLTKKGKAWAETQIAKLKSR
jgi:hypothetical protein